MSQRCGGGVNHLDSVTQEGTVSVGKDLSHLLFPLWTWEPCWMELCWTEPGVAPPCLVLLIQGCMRLDSEA